MMEHKSKPLELYSRDRNTYVRKTGGQKAVVENSNKGVAQNRAVRGGRRARRPSPKLYATVRSGVPIQLAQKSVEEVGKKVDTISYPPIHKPIVDHKLKPDLLSGIQKPRMVDSQSEMDDTRNRKIAEEMQSSNIDDDDEIHPNVVGVTKGQTNPDEISNRYRPFKRRNTEGPLYEPRTYPKIIHPKVDALLSEDDEDESLFESGLIENVIKKLEPPEDGIRMVIANRDHPHSSIGVRRANRIQTNLIELIDETASHCPTPRFHSTEFNRGVIELTCADLNSKKWLQEQLPKLEDSELVLVTPEDIAKMNVMVQVWIPDTADELSVITRLSSQNPGMSFDSWELVFMRKAYPGRELGYTVDKESLELLEKLRFQLHYGLGMITFRPVYYMKPT